jgi:hypothetical protein
MQRSDIDHAMSCNRLSGSGSRQHDHWKEDLSRTSARAGCNACTEPTYASVGAAAVGRQEARADIEVTPPPHHGPTLLEISMIHPRCPTYVAAASQTRGAAAALRDRSKYQAHAGHLHPGHTFDSPLRSAGQTSPDLDWRWGILVLLRLRWELNSAHRAHPLYETSARPTQLTHLPWKQPFAWRTFARPSPAWPITRPLEQMASQPNC